MDPALPTPETFPVRTEIDVRFRDLDAMGHVNNAVFFTYLEVGRTEYVRALGIGPGGAPLPDVFPFILAEISCRFLSPVVLGERVAVHVRCARVGGKSFDFEYLVTETKSGRAVATGRSVQVFYDYRAARTAAVPEALRAKVEALEARVAT